MNFVSKTRNFAFKMMNFVSKTRNFVLKMMYFAGAGRKQQPTEDGNNNFSFKNNDK